MTWLNASWQRLSEPQKWLWRFVMFVLTILNGWECFRHASANNPIVATVDAIFFVVGVGVIIASFA